MKEMTKIARRLRNRSGMSRSSVVVGVLVIGLLAVGYARAKVEQTETLKGGDQKVMKQEVAKKASRPDAGSRAKNTMLLSTIIIGAFAIGLLTVGFLRGHGEHLEGLKGTKKMLVEVLPMLLFAFVVASMAQVLIPHEKVSVWIGKESGIRGILVGCIAGGMAPGGPYVNLPLVAGLMKAGAGIGTGVAFLTAWLIYAVGRLPMEIGIVGLRFTIARLVSTCLFPPLAGLIARALFERG